MEDVVRRLEPCATERLPDAGEEVLNLLVQGGNHARRWLGPHVVGAKGISNGFFNDCLLAVSQLPVAFKTGHLLPVNLSLLALKELFDPLLVRPLFKRLPLLGREEAQVFHGVERLMAHDLDGLCLFQRHLDHLVEIRPACVVLNAVNYV